MTIVTAVVGNNRPTLETIVSPVLEEFPGRCGYQVDCYIDDEYKEGAFFATREEAQTWAEDWLGRHRDVEKSNSND